MNVGNSVLSRVSHKQLAAAPLLTLAWSALLAALLSAAPPDKASARVAVFYRAQSIQRPAASALHRSLVDAGVASILIELPANGDDETREQALSTLAEARPTIVAAGGTKATALALEKLPGIPVVFFMVPNALDAPFMAPDNPDRERVAGVTTDVAPDKQINWITTLSSRVRTVGLLTSPRSAHTAARLAESGKRHGVAVVPIHASKEEFMPAIDALNANDCDAVLMIPDSRVYNSVSVQRLLLWGLRQKKPIATFSAHVVKAGALTGQYCDNEAIGKQTARLILRVLDGTDVQTIGLQYAEHIDVAVNERTADMIGISLGKYQMPPDTVRYGVD